MRIWIRASPIVALLFVAMLGPAALVTRAAGTTYRRCSITGTQGWGKRPIARTPVDSPRINVLEVDAWRHSLLDGTLSPVANVPIAPPDLIRQSHFSPDDYRLSIERLDENYTRQRDVLMYFGGLPAPGSRHGLNFNAWSAQELGRLRERGVRPFIGLETMDPEALDWMAKRLHQAGYGPLHRIYVRIGAEPSGTSYGSEDGTPTGKRHTPAAYKAYGRLFRAASEQLSALNRQYGLNMHRVFAGTSAEDFRKYMPDVSLFDAIGYDLYVTPENQRKTLDQLQWLAARLPTMPLVIPELGVATSGPGASPSWAKAALGDVLTQLGRHPRGVAEVTVFSVDVASRLPKKRWNWAWTPVMFEMLREWEGRPKGWRSSGFHRYDPHSYPVGRDVLYLNRPDLRIVYRKLASASTAGATQFHEVRLLRDHDVWRARARLVTLEST